MASLHAQDTTVTSIVGAHTQLLGELLVAHCGVAQSAIDRGLAKQREDGGLLGDVLLALKLIDEDQLARALATQFDLPYLRDLPKADEIPELLIDKLPINFARQRVVLPLGRDPSGRVIIAVADPHAVEVIDAVSVIIGEPVEPHVAAGSKIINHINKAYSRLRSGAEASKRAPRRTTRRTSTIAPTSLSTCSTPTTRRRSSRGSTR